MCHMAAITLRDGSRTEDPRLDRLVQFDERSRNFPVSAAVPSGISKGKTWSVDERLDQGVEGACVGFGISHELAAFPAAVPGLDNAFARRLYREAQKIDPWPGEDYSGTSVLAGVKVAQSWGFFDEYRWAFSVDDIMRALAHEGPVVVATVWKDSMYEPRPSGLIRPAEGKVVGAHCFLLRGFSLKSRLKGEGKAEPMFRMRNSWGRDWGVKGDAFITVEDYDRYLMDGAEAVIFMGRHKRRPQGPQASEERPRSRFTDPLRYWR